MKELLPFFVLMACQGPIKSGTSTVTATADSDGDGYSATIDCDDQDPNQYPGALELCDGIDNDCDGEADESDSIDAATWYPDNDEDDHGNEDGNPITACEQPLGYVANNDDCDDGNYGANPAQVEVCVDGIDNDCDGEIDEEDAEDAATWYVDNDEDGYGSAEYTTKACTRPDGYVSNDYDCDDTKGPGGAIHPEADEYCDGADNDCDGEIDEAPDEDEDEAGALDAETYYHDDDGDGYGNADVTITACSPSSDYIADASDCDDDDDEVNPGAEEICDYIDNDCDDDIDGDLRTTYYEDKDSDSFGNEDVYTSVCEQPAGYVANDADCDDTRSSVNPDGLEVCGDGLDNDCSGDADGSDSSDATTWFIDNDGDGYGHSSISQQACTRPDGYDDSWQDCDDDEADAYPNNTEVCNDGINNDCSTEEDDSCVQVSEDLADADGIYVGGVDGGMLGFSVAIAGDVDGDGQDDILMSAPYASTSSTYEGWVLLETGPETDQEDSVSAANVDGILSGEQNEDDGEYSTARTGWSVAAAGDVNNDGFDDILVGSPFANANGTRSGAAYIVMGNFTTMNLVDADARIIGADDQDFAGAAVLSAGDVNGDGVPDTLIGAPGIDSQTGGAYLLFGPASSGNLSDADVTITSTSVEGSYSGLSLASGDLDGDGLSDFLVGERGSDADGDESTGSVALFLGSNWGGCFWHDASDEEENDTGSETADGDTSSSDTDTSESASSDTSDTGTSGSWVCESEISSIEDSSADVTISWIEHSISDATFDEIDDGYSYLTGGNMAVSDVNGDGYGDLLVGATGATPGEGTHGGAVYIMLGTASASEMTSDARSPDGAVTHEDENGRLGFSVSSAGDNNGDGYGDFLVGAPGATNDNDDITGVVYLVTGPVTGTISAEDLIDYPGNTEGGMAGFSVAGTGSVDGDPYDDILVGAPNINDDEATDCTDAEDTAGCEEVPLNYDLGQVFVLPGTGI